MQQNVPSPLTSAIALPEPSVIDVRQGKIKYFSRTIHQTIRFRHSIGSPSLSLPGVSNDFDDVVAEENAAELPNFLKIRRLAIKEDLIKSFKGNEVSTYEILQHLCFLNNCLSCGHDKKSCKFALWVTPLFVTFNKSKEII